MHFYKLIKTAVKGLQVHKSRSALTILGIVIGITAIILVMSIGAGAQDLIIGQLQGIGSRTIVVIPGREPQGPTDPAIIDTILSDSLKERDLKALQSKINVPTLDNAMPILFGSETAAYAGDTFRVTLYGGTELFGEFFDFYPENGVFLSEEDVRGRASVVVLGSKSKEELFGDSDAVGERIKIKGKTFRVIGVLPKKGQVSFVNFDETAIIPYTTAQQYIFGFKHFNRIITQAKTEADIPQTVEDIERTLRNLHGITDPEKDDFFIETQADLVDRLTVITSVLTALLVSIAAISLVVGGVGIMNIMLVSVTERTREIGLRKAIGATESDIMNQFLLESILLTGVGGLLGVLLGAALTVAATVVLNKFVGIPWDFVFPLKAVYLGVGVSAAIGLVFGLYPARNAAQKSPIEALRYE